MTKEALKLALEALETLMIERGSIYDKAITAIKEALANEALEKMAENARELGLDYEPEQDWIERERAVGYREGHQNAIKQMAQPEQEPVAWVSTTELLVMRGNAYAGAKNWRINLGLEPEEGDVGLFTIPPQRTWVNATTWRGLTDEEILSISADCASSHQHMDIHFARAIEAKLKAKNSL